MRLNFWSKYMQLVSRALINVLYVLCSEISVLSNSVTPWTAALCPWDFPSKNTGVGCYFLLQGIFPTQDQSRISCTSCVGRQILYHCATWKVHFKQGSGNILSGGSVVMNLPANAGREGDGTPLQYSCLENPMDGGAWWTAVHGVAKSQT